MTGYRDVREGPDRKLGGLSDGSGGAQTEFGTVVGTPRYMSPEQAQGRIDEVGPGSDQCALGLMLFEMVTLKPVHSGHTPQEILNNAAAARRVAFSHAYERAIDQPFGRSSSELRARIQDRYPNVGEWATI